MDLVKCPFCGKDIENDSYYCDQCGEGLKICPSGHGFRKGKICNQCGDKLVDAKIFNSNQAPPSPSPAPAAAMSPPQATEARPQQPFVNMQPSPQVSNVAPQPAGDPEKTVRPTAASAEPKYLVSNALNARLELKNGAVIGRRAGDYINTFANQGYVSGTHARLQKNPTGAWEIVDLDSSNGTYLNRQKLTAHQPAAFKVGDTLAFYDLTFVVE